MTDSENIVYPELNNTKNIRESDYCDKILKDNKELNRELIRLFLSSLLLDKLNSKQ